MGATSMTGNPAEPADPGMPLGPPVNLARGVHDRTHPYVVERGPQPVPVAGGTGAVGQRRAEAVRERADRALEQERTAAPEQVGQLRRAAGGRDRLPDAFDDQVRQLARQHAEVGREHLDHVECLVERNAGPDPVRHLPQQRGTAHHEVVLAVRAHHPDLVGAAERGRIQRRQPVGQFRPGQQERRLVQRRLALVDAEQRREVRAALPGPEQVPYSRQRVAAALQARDELQALDVPAAVQAQTSPALGRRQQAHRVVLADRANRQLDPLGELVDGERLIGGNHGLTIPQITVTVNTVTVNDDLNDRLLTVLRNATGAPGLEYDRRPEPMSGGFWAELFSLSLANPPDEWPAELVARLMPDPDTARKETIV